MEGQNNNSKLKAIIVILAILLAGSLAYMYKMSSDAKTTQTTLVADKESVMKDLQALKATYDQAIAENTSMSDELIAEREKVVKLMADLDKAKADVASLSKYRNQARSLEGKLKTLMAEIEVLKKENAGLIVERDSTVQALGEQKRFNDTLVIQNENLAKTIEKGSQLTVMNLRTTSMKERSSGKLVETERARRVDKLKVCFTLAENKIAKSGTKTYYVQVIDPKNNVLGEKQTVNFGEQTLTYSFTTSTDYANQAVDVCEMLSGSDFEKGAYFVNIFDKNELVSKTTFNLK